MTSKNVTLLSQAAEVGQVMALPRGVDGSAVSIPHDINPSAMHKQGADESGTCFSPHCGCIEACDQFEGIVQDVFLQSKGG